MELPQSFFLRPVRTVAPELLGMHLVREHRGVRTAYRITEVEAYDGEDDQACHAAKGRTPRTEVLYGPGGHWYVYLIYGLHFMLNVTAGPAGYPSGVLIRSVEGITGPGRVTKALGVTKAFYGLPAEECTGLWIEDRGTSVPAGEIVTTPRIGVAYAGAWAEKPWRYLWQPPAV